MSPFWEDRRLDSPAAVEQYLFEELPSLSSTVMTGHGVGVRRASHLVSELGDPHEDLHVVHVAGTAGKGSVCALLSAVLEVHPHLPHALDRARSTSRPGAPIAAPGSFHTVAAAGVVAPRTSRRSE